MWLTAWAQMLFIAEFSRSHHTVLFPLRSLCSPAGSALAVTGWLPAALGVTSFPLSFRRRKRKSTSLRVQTKIPELISVSPDWPDLGHYPFSMTNHQRQGGAMHGLGKGWVTGRNPRNWGTVNPTPTTWLNMGKSALKRLLGAFLVGEKRSGVDNPQMFTLSGGHS